MPKSINYTNNGDGTATLDMSWTATKTKLDDMGSDAGEYFYNSRWTLYDGEDPIPWGDLTNAQKLNVLLQESTRHLREGAYAQYTHSTVDTAKAGMDSATDKYNMED